MLAINNTTNVHSELGRTDSAHLLMAYNVLRIRAWHTACHVSAAGPHRNPNICIFANEVIVLFLTFGEHWCVATV